MGSRPPPGPKWRHLAVLGAASLLLLWFAGRESRIEDISDFDVDLAPKGEEKPRVAYVSLAEQELARRMGVSPVGLVPEPAGAYAEDAPGAADPVPAQTLGGPPEFGAMIQRELKRLNKITRRYYQNEPKVREVDKAFSGLPRYMGVKRKYDADRDAYAFAHDAIALPEVRKTIRRYALDANVWRVTLGMVREGLKEKPPQPLYDEMKRFFTKDPAIVGFASELSAYVAPRLPALLPQVLKPGQDLAALKALAKDLNIGKNGVVAPPQALASAPPPQQSRLDSHKGEKIAGTEVPVLPDSELKIGETQSQKNQQINDLGKGSRPRQPSVRSF